MQLAEQYDFIPSDIKEIEIGTGDWIYSRNCVPVEVRHHPKTGVDGQFSIPYLVCRALIDHKLDLSHITDEAVRRPEVLQLLQRVHSMIDPEIDKVAIPRTVQPARIRVTTKDGKIYEHRMDEPRGHTRNPMTPAEFIGKFHYCAGHAAKQLPRENLEKGIQMINNLEQVDNVNEIWKFFT